MMLNDATVQLGDLRAALASARTPATAGPFDHICIDLDVWPEGKTWLLAHIATEEALSPLARHCFIEEDELLHGNIQLGQITALYTLGHPGDEYGALALSWMTWWIEQKPAHERTSFDELYLEAFHALEQAGGDSRTRREKALQRAWRRIFRRDVGWPIHPEDFGAWLILRAHARRRQARPIEFHGVKDLLARVIND